MTSCCVDDGFVRSKQTKMVSLSIASLSSFFTEEQKSVSRGENHYQSEHVGSFIYDQGVLRVEVRASMKNKVYKVTVRNSRYYYMFPVIIVMGNTTAF